MLKWWRLRQSDRERVTRQADELIALHRDDAYGIARDHRIRTLQEQQQQEHRFWSAVARMIADRTRREVGVDTATRYLEALPPDCDALADEQVPNAGDQKEAPVAASNRAGAHLRLVPKQ
jgi:hypothetical protein